MKGSNGIRRDLLRFKDSEGFFVVLRDFKGFIGILRDGSRQC